MYNITGQSIAVVSDSISENGVKNTTTALGLIIIGIAGSALVYYLCQSGINNTKRTNAQNLSCTKCNNTIKTTQAKTEAAIKLDDHKTANKEKILRLKAQLIKEKARNDETFELKKEVRPMKSFDDILAMEDVEFEDRVLLYSFLQKGDSLGICGPTHIGKTTFLFQLLLSLATVGTTTLLPLILIQSSPKKYCCLLPSRRMRKSSPTIKQ
ncbi:MAG: hypothetical protein K2M93_00085 [Muribaculaceae bacterium]|nr:hypothetical protein [Muribaculaceae bacterium]